MNTAKFRESANMFSEEGGLQRSTLKSQVADKIIYMISTGLISADDFLPSERKLCEAFGVSRETVRAALQILTQDKVIEIKPGSRTRILFKPEILNQQKPLPGLGELQDYDITTVAEARSVVEVSILRSAAINITDEELELLAEMIDTQEKVLDDPIAFQISDREFHILIYKSGGNELLEKMAHDIYSYALEHRHMALKTERATERSLREHKQIYRALQNHDPDAAERAITDHVDSIFKSSILMSNQS